MAKINYVGTHARSHASLQTWLNLARTNIGLSQTMGFLNKNDSSADLAILGELSSGLSLTVAFRLSLSIGGLFQGARRDILRNTIMF